MSKEWAYAKMSLDAASAGGPEQWLETIKATAYNAGAADEKAALLLPLLAIGAGLGTVCTLGVQKLRQHINEKKQTRQLAQLNTAEAETLLLADITGTDIP